MRIALISTCAVPTPPPAYGGTERVVAGLARGLVELGHEVVVYATGDSRPAGSLQWLFPRGQWPPNDESERRHAQFALTDLRAQGRVDIVHSHHTSALEFHHLVDVPTAVTLHDCPDEAIAARCRAHPEVAIVAISRRQAELVADLNIARVIHHGIDVDRYALGRGDGGYVAFLGRFTPEKSPHLAVDAAAAAGIDIHLGGCPQPYSRAYFEREMAPRLARYARRIHWPGELEEQPKIEMLRRARALLFPIGWEEPFGLVLIEAMLVGTPVIAFPRGSVPELVDEGVTGFMVRNVDEMAARVRTLEGFDRERCRARARERWSYRRMAREHADLYQELVASRRRRRSVSRLSLPSAPPR